MNDPSNFKIWMMAIRPKTLPAAISPVLIGIAFAVRDDHFNFFPAFAALLGALILQIGANLANDYSDFHKGTDTADRIGPVRVAASGLLDVTTLRNGLIVTLVIAMVIGLYLIWIGGIVILLIGTLSLIFLLAYSGGPWPYGYRGLGDFFVFVFFGLFAVSGTYYVQALHFNNNVIIGSIAPGTLITAILVVNNYRDIETDRKTGKNTLAVMLGKQWTIIEFILLLLIAYLIPIYLLVVENYSSWVLLPLISSPFSLNLVRIIKQTSDGKILNDALAQTAKTGLLFNLLFALGIAL
ncbi:MAG: 1,4-dihydroxy-2-naphthoate polyprenyltransferase [Candidatus Kariarchaeaceae archaeon]|jgi:1,4-dihydroxy-2-naphthoate octaprenyltransferase